jgi:hypothetical protein
MSETVQSRGPSGGGLDRGRDEGGPANPVRNVTVCFTTGPGVTARTGHAVAKGTPSVSFRSAGIALAAVSSPSLK